MRERSPVTNPGVDIGTFFHEEGIGPYAAVDLTCLEDADRSDALHLVPGAGSVIVFGREVPVQVYQLPPAEKTLEMLRIGEATDRVAVRLANRLRSEHIPAVPVPLLLPVTMHHGRLQGIIRLKRIAASGGLGTIGRSGLLISPVYGTRLILSGVVTALDGEHCRKMPVANICQHCGRCIRACPGGAIGPDGVDSFRCRNISAWVPAPLIPAAQWLLNRKTLQSLATPLAPVIARHATMRCSFCVTVCPYFEAGEPARQI
jgi:epoxyqueuosine reductase